MVQQIEAAAQAQAITAPQAAPHHSPAKVLATAMADAVVLSSQAMQVIDRLRDGKTIAEAWLDHITAPPDLTTLAASSDGNSPQAQAAGGSDTQSMAVVNQAVRTTLSDLSWLLDALHPPKVDTGKVAQELARRMALDNLGTIPQLQDVRAQADHTGTTAALYVENLSVTVQKGTVVNASIDRVALTTVDTSIRDRVAGSDRPVVVNIGDDAQGTAQALQAANTKSQEKAAEAAQQQTVQAEHALLILRQGGTRHPEGTVQVKMDALLPL